ncbi:hypothetical protein CDD80_3237 [Ophiocordyceps camponoti-rufipedis]|uniref:Uncharacterized protein n=1 Tax=Ophiocordyceps camponoti-rufipedis TaxID=2004952 RepID=A0A2C5XJ15_9HYPO|nr:hypothetical protein CDD80_3237 [Ophiocordyceps camponoti-rufipedis]
MRVCAAIVAVVLSLGSGVLAAPANVADLADSPLGEAAKKAQGQTSAQPQRRSIAGVTKEVIHHKPAEV